MVFTEDFFDKILDFGTDWRVINVDLDHVYQEVFLDIEYVGIYKDPQTN